MSKEKSPKSAAKDDNKTKFVNQKKISPEKSMKTKLDRVPKNETKNKLKK